GLGCAARAAAQAALDGAGGEGAGRAARRLALEGSIFLYGDTLDYLRRGGRVGAAAAMGGSALAVKPLLNLADGRLEPIERVRTASRALARLEELAVRGAGTRPVDMAVQHLAAPERAEEMAERLRRRLPQLRSLHLGEV